MTSINPASRPTYVYDSNTSQWYEIGGKTDTGATYIWTGVHQFDNLVSFQNSVVTPKGVNIFLNPSDRDIAIPSPSYGTTVFIKQDASGNTIDDYQFYDGSVWKSLKDPVFSFAEKFTSYTLQSIDAYKMIEMSGGGNLVVPSMLSVDFPLGTAIDIVQTGSNQVTIVPASGVTVNATPGLKLRTQWSSATLIKRGLDTWLLTGDLVA